MYTVSYEEFKALIEKRRRTEKKAPTTEKKEAVLRPDQLLNRERQQHTRRLATCPGCDSVVDADILHLQSGLCPRCHELHL